MDTIRKGNHALYKGKEYRLVSLRNNIIKITSNDPEDMKNGFTKYMEDVYSKPVEKSDLTETFTIVPWARYKGLSFSLRGMDATSVSLITEDKVLANKLDFEAPDKFYWEKWVRRDELDSIWEEKIPLDISGW